MASPAEGLVSAEVVSDAALLEGAADGKEEKTYTGGDAKEKQVEAEEACLGNADLLEHVLSFLPTPEDVGRAAAVSRGFRAACASRATIHAQLARASFPRAAALKVGGIPGFELDRKGLGLMIARALRPTSAANAPNVPAALPISAYSALVVVRATRWGCTS
jgi:hypothetical protein